MEHSLTAYLRRQSTQTLMLLLKQYEKADDYYQQFIPIILNILKQRVDLGRKEQDLHSDQV